MHLRPHAVSAGSVACRVVDSPVSTLDARSCHALDSHGSPHNAAVPGLEVSRGDVLQHQLIQAQLCHQPLRLRVLLLQILQPPGLVHPQTAILFTPPELGLLHDSRFLTRLWRRLSVRHGYFDLPQKGHNLFCTMLLASRHLPLLLFQFVSTPLVQIEPGTPNPFSPNLRLVIVYTLSPDLANMPNLTVEFVFQLINLHTNQVFFHNPGQRSATLGQVSEELYYDINRGR